MGIQQDFDVGDQGEKLVRQRLGDIGIPSLPVAKEDRSFFDVQAFLSDGYEFTLEVKNDLYEAKSGNIAIEIYNPKSDKLSGIGITTADLWVHVTDGLYVTRVSDLRQYIAKTPPKRKIAAGGDNNATLLLYDSKEIFEAIFHRIDNISDEETEKIILSLLGRV